MNKDPKITVVIFLCSSASLAFEVLLSRMFSVSLWYHFAYMIISIAMLGFAASGVLLSLLPQLKNIDNLPRYALCLGIAIPLGYLLANQIPFDPVRLAWQKSELFHVGLYYLVLAVPFFFAGLVVATAFAVASDQAGRIYGADLLGAGFGSLGVLLLMEAMAPERGVFLIASPALAAALINRERMLRIAALLAILANLALFRFQPEFTQLRISPYKGLSSALRYPGAEHLRTYSSPFSRIDTFLSPAVRYAPGLSLRYQEQLPKQIGIAVDGGEINAVTGDAGRKALTFLEYLPSALPYALGKRDDVLVLDPGGGLQILLARHYGAGRISAVEANPDLIRIIHDDFHGFSGGIYDDRTWSGLGRSWLMGRSDRFDLIDISLQGAEPSGGFAISEDYRFTVEAFREYLAHLKDNGVLCFNLFILPPPRIELRIVSTAVSALKDMGISDAAGRIAAVRSWGSVTILVKKSPLTPAELATLRRFAGERWFDPVYYPGVKPDETNRFVKTAATDYAGAFAAILSPTERDIFTERYLFDIRPAHDEAPFFHHFLKLDKIRDIYRTMGEKWQFFLEEGYILPAVFIQVLFLSLLLLLMPYLAGEKQEYATGKNLLPCFALLGLGFMFIEVSLIQKLILPLENPSYAVAAVLASLLINSGCGSLLSHRHAGLQRPATMAAIALLTVVYALLLPPVTNAIAPLMLPSKVITLFLLITPLGLLMGIPFPTALSLLGERNPQLIPWAWAINGCFSVLAPILAVILAMATGFKGVLLLAAGAYFLAYLNLKAVNWDQGSGIRDQ